MRGLDEPIHLRTHGSGRQRPLLSRLILTGFMGAGKSTIGPLLAQALGWRFLDLDSVIEADCGQTVAEIFHQHGEAYFRQQERRLAEQLGQERQLVLALGGGAVEDPSTLATLLSAPGSCMVFLDAPLPELMARVRSEDGIRPLLKKEEELESRFRRRLPHYRAAHLTIVTTGSSPEEVTAHILSHVRQKWLI